MSSTETSRPAHSAIERPFTSIIRDDWHNQLVSHVQRRTTCKTSNWRRVTVSPSHILHFVQTFAIIWATLHVSPTSIHLWSTLRVCQSFFSSILFDTLVQSVFTSGLLYAFGKAFPALFCLIRLSNLYSPLGYSTRLSNRSLLISVIFHLY